VEKAVFSNVDLTIGAPAATTPKLYSTLETVPLSVTGALSMSLRAASHRLCGPPTRRDSISDDGGGTKKIPAAAAFRRTT